MNKQLFVAVTWLVPLTAGFAFAAENLLRDVDFRHVGRADSAWQVAAGQNGQTEPVPAADGQISALHLKAAAASQSVTLPAGLFELTVQARGTGELILGVSDSGERSQMLGKDWATFGYLFHANEGGHTVTIRITVDGVTAAAAIRPATEAQQAAWERAEQSFQQFGFVTVSPQRPSPGSAPLEFHGNVRPLAAMTQRAVLDEPRLNAMHAQNVDRLVNWLGANGFTRLDGDRLATWMTELIQHGDAYGSVMVLARGVTPGALMAGPPDNPHWLEYLRAGGRIVHAGDMPFNYTESPDVAPLDFDLEGRGPVLLGLGYSWDSPYCGQGGLPVSATAAAKDWGLENADGPLVGMPVENVSLAFHVYTVPATGKQGATDWFRNVRPDMPWSGLIKMLQEFNGNDDAALRDVWRAANYVGHPVTIPALPVAAEAPPPKLTIQTVAGGQSNRHEFVRGEKVEVLVTQNPALRADHVRVALAVPSSTGPAELPLQVGTTAFELDTAPYADGDYQLTATALAGSNTVATISQTIGIRCLPPENFAFEIVYAPGSNPRRIDLELADIQKAGMELQLRDAGPVGVDAAVRHHLGFSFSWSPDMTRIGGKTVTFAQNPEYFRLDGSGKPIPVPGYSGGRPSLGLSHPAARASAAAGVATQVRAVAGLPSFRPYLLCNDDFQGWYGWDYAPHVVEAFRAATGLEPPRQMELPPAVGAISDNNPWVRWFEWTLLNVDGAYNKAETAAAVAVRPDVRIGPVPGGMQIPLVSMWQPAQYPPDNFGTNGFNLISSYYYNSYWQPILTTTYWMEIGRMGNRDLPEWNMPDVMSTAGYTRNNFYHYLAGGVRGLVYFWYSARSASAWAEVRHLGQVIRRLGPVQARLQPAPRDIGLLNSFTSDCFSGGLAVVQAYAYHNLMQGHYSVEPISEDEILAGRARQYKAILLYDVNYLRQSVYDALRLHAANGGLVLLDQSVPFDIPGAKRLAIDVGMGLPKTSATPRGSNQLSNPGIQDYGHPDRVAAVARALAAYLPPQFASPDIHVVASPFTADGVAYTWFVNAQDSQEYLFCREAYCDPAGRKPAKMKRVRDWEATELAKGPYVTTVEYATVPGVPYDLLSGQKLRLTKLKSGRYALTLRIERFGGTLVAWLPGEINGVRLSAPKTVRAQQPIHCQVTVLANGRPVPGPVPVEFVLRDPQGHESIISRVCATKDGQAAFSWTPAINDFRGTWRLQACELASGQKAQAKLVFRK